MRTLKEMGSENKNQLMLSVTSGILRVSEKVAQQSAEVLVLEALVSPSRKHHD